jgi:urease gamma subunit
MKTTIGSDDPDASLPLEVSPRERHEMIAVAAYLLAERRSFTPGRELEDWFEAAAAIDRMLASMSRAGVTRTDYERAGLRNALRLWVG